MCRDRRRRQVSCSILLLISMKVGFLAMLNCILFYSVALLFTSVCALALGCACGSQRTACGVSSLLPRGSLGLNSEVLAVNTVTN